MGAVISASAAAVDAETEQLPESEGPEVMPFEGACGGVQVTMVGGNLVDGNVSRRCGLLTWRHQLI
jgi:hypothetical protein